MEENKKMSKVLNHFIIKEYQPLLRFRLETMELLFGEGELDKTDEEMHTRIRELLNQHKEVDNSEVDSHTRWALDNIS